MERQTPAQDIPRTPSRNINRRRHRKGDGKTVFFGGVPKSTPKRTVFSYFSTFGAIKEVSLEKRDSKHPSRHHLPTTLHRGCGFVEFRVKRAADKARRQVSHIIEGVSFEVRLALSGADKKRRDA